MRLNMNTAETQPKPFFLHPFSRFCPAALLAVMRLQKLAGLEDQTALVSRLIASYQGISRTEETDGMETEEHSPFSPFHDNGNQPIDLRCDAKKERDGKPKKSENRETKQINILLEIYQKLQHLNNTKNKLKLLKKERKQILREKQRIRQLRQQLKRGKAAFNCNEPASTSITQPPSSPSSSIDSGSPIRKPSIWRPIEFPPSPPLSASSPVSETMENTPLQQTLMQEQGYSPRTSPIATSKHYQRLPSNQSFISEIRQRTPSTSPALSSSPSSQSSPPPLSSDAIPDIEQLPCDENGMVTIGPNGTKIPKGSLQNIEWSLKETYIIRKLLMEVFDRDTLALHNLSGKPSPAFFGCNKPLKGKLDPLKVKDFVHFIMKYLKITEKEVRQTITIKCADENKRVRNELLRVLGKGRDSMKISTQT